MQAARGGLTLTDIEQRFEVSRRTAIRMRDAVITAFPQADEVASNDRAKHWRLSNNAARPLLGITADDLSSLENAAGLLARENLLDQAEELRGVASKIRATLAAELMRKIDPDLGALAEAEGIAMRPGPRPAIAASLFATLRTAIKSCRKVSFRYVGRVSAHDLETIIVARLMTHLSDPAVSIDAFCQDPSAVAQRIELVQQAREKLVAGTAAERRGTLLDWVASVRLNADHIVISLISRDPEQDRSRPLAKLIVDAVRIRRGHDIRLILAAPTTPVPKRDVRLVKLIAEAFATRLRLQEIGIVSISQAAVWLGCCRLTLTERIKLSYLAPDIVELILAGRQPKSLTRRRLAEVKLPIDWQDQHKILGMTRA